MVPVERYHLSRCDLKRGQEVPDEDARFFNECFNCKLIILVPQFHRYLRYVYCEKCLGFNRSCREGARSDTGIGRRGMTPRQCAGRSRTGS